MIQKLLSLLLMLSVSFSSYAQVANPPDSILICDDDNDGFAQFDLTVINSIILGSQNPADYTITYHETQSDSENGINPILNPVAYFTVSNPQTIFVRLEDNSTSNFDTTSFQIYVNQLPEAVQPTPLEVCDDNGDGFTLFDLTVKNSEISGGNPNFWISYYETQNDSENGTNQIFSSADYLNVSNPQTIYARVENGNTGCFTIVNFDIIVNPLPIVDISGDYTLCSDGSNTLILDTILPDDGSYSFEWYLNTTLLTTVIGSSYEVTQSGNYTVMVSDSQTFCENTSTAIVVMEDCTDSDSDGVIDVDEDINGNGILTDDDTDEDSIPDYLDDDDDGDNVPTVTELNVSQGSTSSRLHQFVDTDTDAIENYIDDDDDGDGVLTKDEDYNNNGTPLDDDTNGNFIPDYLDATVALSVETFQKLSFSLIPNPASKMVSLKLNANYDDKYSVDIFDIQGKQIFSSEINEGFTINISALNSGLYFVKLYNSNVSQVQKLIVK